MRQNSVLKLLPHPDYVYSVFGALQIIYVLSYLLTYLTKIKLNKMLQRKRYRN